MRFTTKQPPNCVQSCLPSPCEQAQNDSQTLSRASSKVIKKYSSKPELAATPCGKKVQTLSQNGTLTRFDSFTEALPYANAALAVNELGDSNKLKKSKNCLTMLPLSGADLSQTLGLPAGTIKDKDLRDDTTGFRAAMLRNEADGSLILVARDTQPDSLVDWQTNTDNGQGRDTEQYDAMRHLTTALDKNNIDFNLAGYSKGGGLHKRPGWWPTIPK